MATISNVFSLIDASTNRIEPSKSIETKYNEMKTLDNALLQKYEVKLYGSDRDTYDIINDYLQENQSEEAFYIVDLGEIVNSYNNWIKLLPDVKLYYAVKCNPNPVIIEVLSTLGVNFDAASQSEIRSVIDITKDPTRIIFANPCKMTSQIKYARSNDVDLLVFDNEEELYKIKLYHPNSKLVLRLAVDDSKSKCRFSKKFGCKIIMVEELLKIANTLKLNIIGFSFHVGSNCLSAESFYEALCDCRKATDISAKYGFQINIIDIGGGFTSINPNIKFEDVACRINDGIHNFFEKELDNNSIEFISEVGRYFVEKSHTLVLNVIGKKIVNDSESNEQIIEYYLNESTYGSFNCINNDHYRPNLLAFNERTENLKKSRCWGVTCDGGDLICDSILLPDLAIGECLFVENMGAYTISAASSGFNGFAPTSVCKYIYKDNVQN
jgi:diaminopimelate decarboxylase